MMKKILLGVVVLVLGFVGLVATRPAELKVERTAMIKAAPDAVLANVSDFHKWDAWSPWAKLDPNMKTTFGGAAQGVGAKYHWTGNDKVGEGSMEILAMAADHVDVALEFVKPFPQTSQIRISAIPDQAGMVKTSWVMTMQQGMMGKAMGLFMDMDKMVGPDFEKGLAQLKTVAEAMPAAAAAAPAGAMVASPAVP